jgi:hypothetical protein
MTSSGIAEILFLNNRLEGHFIFNNQEYISTSTKPSYPMIGQESKIIPNYNDCCYPQSEPLFYDISIYNPKTQQQLTFHSILRPPMNDLVSLTSKQFNFKTVKLFNQQDTKNRLQAYKHSFHPDMLMVLGSLDLLDFSFPELPMH